MAVLIDAENVPPSALDQVMSAVSKRGTAETRRAYGRWPEGKIAAWKDVLRRHAFCRVSLDPCLPGKNAADIALTIGAMELLHEGKHEGFCIVSSDSDFAPLARRLRESSRKVFGFGESKASPAWREECSAFVEIGVVPEAPERIALRKQILATVKAAGGVDDYIRLSAVGQKLSAQGKPVRGLLKVIESDLFSGSGLLQLKRQGMPPDVFVRLLSAAAE
ncbi:NYN domain-containing protein [Roseomonas sp. AR75]|uniref:NYN domain-containing protein n=1 Tax=Roseomonas sp. AR75 TaxID=2562311 RepID=UPI001484FD16|nr:NYN domain-containing protein [Roseomonas sp. AR75]